MSSKITKTDKRIRLKRKIRSRIFGTAERPRFSVFRSNTAIYAQLIDDNAGKTIISANDQKVKGSKMEKAMAVGESLAKDALAKGIKSVVFDRNGFKYTGRIMTLADSARKGGLKF